MLDRPLRPYGTLLVSALALGACSSDRGPSEQRVPASSAEAGAVRAIVTHADVRGSRGPSFAWLAAAPGVRFADAREAAEGSLRGVALAFGVDAAALASFEPASIDKAQGGAVFARFRQRVHGVEVFRAGVTVAMRASFDPVAASGFVAKDLTGASRSFARDGRAAVEVAASAMGLPALTLTLGDVDGDYQHFASPQLRTPARVKKVFFPANGSLEPAHYVELVVPGGPAWSLVVSATDGQVLFTNDLVRHDAYSYRVYADATTKVPFDGPQGDAMTPHPTGAPDGTKPTWIAPQLVTIENFPFSKNDPWLPPDATTTWGNNVRAYPDRVQPAGPTGDIAVALTGAKTFDYTYDTAQSPGGTTANVQAATTHLFYVTNFMHDWFYDAGFDEASGNHQADNFGRGGLGRDPLRAEAQDYSGRNNANAMVPSDGASPQIQMYVFSGPSVAELSVAAPASLAGSKNVGLAGFGVDAFDTTGNVVLGVDDQGADPSDACEPLAGSVAGRIVLVRRGTCSFIQKAQFVEAAGGVGVIIANVASSAQSNVAPFMGGAGSNANVGIPVLSLSLGDGQAMEAALASGTVTVTMHRALQTDLDGALDTTIVAHEWGHVLSSRLVGDGNGLTTNQAGALGEGWADFVALLLSARASDVEAPSGLNWSGAYQSGAYATIGGGADFYYGIRRVPYSVDFAKNGLTFKHITNGVPLPSDMPVSFGEDGSFNAQVHSAGEVWATMLWECFVALLRDPRHTFEQAQDRMKRYLVAGLKLTPIDPTFLEARDALLAAALAADEADYRSLWEAFGRRGAGVGALGPPKDSSTNDGVKESFFVGNDVQIVDAKIVDDVISCDGDGILDEGEVGTLTFTVRNSGPGALSSAVARLSSPSPGVRFVDGPEVKLTPLAPFETTEVRTKAQVMGVDADKPIVFEVVVSDPTFGEGRTQRLELTARVSVDEAVDAATVDRVDTKETAWSVSAVDDYQTKGWSREMNGLEGKWVVPDSPRPVEHLLTSPPFALEGTSFELVFKHRHSFRFSTRRQVDVDGGVVEISLDQGATWTDLSTYGAVDYNTRIDDSRGDNPLAGRAAYGNRSAGYPDGWVTSRVPVELGTPPEWIMVRFRVGCSTGFSGAPGWEIDEVELHGTSTAPFWGFVPHADACDPSGPSVAAGAGRRVTSGESVALEGTGTHPEGLPITFVWSQVDGPSVTLPSEGPSRFEFVAPEVTEPTTLRFALRGHDGARLSAASLVDVEVVRGDAPIAESCGCSTVGSGARSPLSIVGATAALGALLARRRRARLRA